MDEHEKAVYALQLDERKILQAAVAQARETLEQARSDLDNGQQTHWNEPLEQKAQRIDELRSEVSAAETRVMATEQALDDHKAQIVARHGENRNHSLEQDLRAPEPPSWEERAHAAAHKVIDVVDVALGTATKGVPVSEVAEAARLAVDAAKTAAEMHPKALDDAAVSIAGTVDRVNEWVGRAAEAVVPGYTAAGPDTPVPPTPEPERSPPGAAPAPEPPDPMAELQQRQRQEIVDLSQQQEQLRTELVESQQALNRPEAEIGKLVERQEEVFRQQSVQMAERHEEERQAQIQPRQMEDR